jgi:hypothetical protein
VCKGGEVTARAFVGTQLATSCLLKSTAGIGMKETYVTSYARDMHGVRLKIDAKRETASSMNNARSGTMTTMVPTMTNPTIVVLWLEVIMKGGIEPFSHDFKWVRWPLNFKLSGIEKYDGSTNLPEWLDVY